MRVGARESREACGWARALQSDTARPQCARAGCSPPPLPPFAGVPVSPAAATRVTDEGQLIGRRGCMTGGALVNVGGTTAHKVKVFNQKQKLEKGRDIYNSASGG